jgi:hypothetical protein
MEDAWMGNSNASKYGGIYWGVRSELSQTGEIYVHADTVEVTPNGELIFWHNNEDGTHRHQTLGFAPGSWACFFAASVEDGHAVAVEHWDGEAAE